jgi:hypothetical protein
VRKDMLLTVEIKNEDKVSDSEVAICFDEEGLSFLVERLSALKGKLDHTHLMTPSWAGNELTEVKQGGDEYTLGNHLRLVKVKDALNFPPTAPS